MNPDYLLAAVGWSLAGFVVGYVTAHVLTHKEGFVNDHPRLRPYVPNRTLGVALVLLAILSVVSLAVVSTQRQNVSECQAKVNLGLIRAIEARAKIADDDRRALDDLVLAIVNTADLPETQQQRAVASALQTYTMTITKSRNDRARYRLPTPRDYACGGFQ